MKTNCLLLLTFIFSINILFSQTTTTFKDTGSISNQIDNILDNSNRYEDFKVVKINWLLQLKNNINDSVSVYKNKIIAVNSTINAQKQTIDSLKIALNTSNKTITNLSNEIQTISLFGFPISKSGFKTTLFLIILVLAILLVFFISKFKQSNTITVQVKKDFIELEEDFDTHRKNALEREQKVRRELLDEINKHKKEK
jgi:hypothetical protein